jgi:hypothetical protein
MRRKKNDKKHLRSKRRKCAEEMSQKKRFENIFFCCLATPHQIFHDFSFKPFFLLASLMFLHAYLKIKSKQSRAKTKFLDIMAGKGSKIPFLLSHKKNQSQSYY